MRSSLPDSCSFQRPTALDRSAQRCVHASFACRQVHAGAGLFGQRGDECVPHTRQPVSTTAGLRAPAKLASSSAGTVDDQLAFNPRVGSSACTIETFDAAAYES